MSIRAQILEATVARLEAERFQPMSPEPPPQGPPPITEAQARLNAQRLLEALSDDPVVVAFADTHTSRDGAA